MYYNINEKQNQTKKMKRNALALMIMALLSNIIKGNFLTYSGLGFPYETWIGSSAFSTATAVFLSSCTVVPTGSGSNLFAVIIYIYYTAIYLLVSVLALRLIWVPIVDLVSELDMILSKILLYFNRSVFPNAKTSVIKKLGIFLGTKTATLWSANILGLIFLYAVSTDILNYLASYFYSLPNCGIFSKMRSNALNIIYALLNLINSKKIVKFHWEPQVKYYTPKQHDHSKIQNYYDQSEYL